MGANQTHAGARVHDAVMQSSPPLFNAGALRSTYARARVFKLKVAKFAQPDGIFGRISFFAACGDHLQLPPVPKSSSLIAPLEGTSDEHKAGARIFANFAYHFEMHTMQRFEDPTLVAILQKMRGPKDSAKLSDAEWRGLKDTEVDVERLERDPAAFEQATAGWFEACYLWSVAAMGSYTRATLSARQHKEILFYGQAVDESEQITKEARENKWSTNGRWASRAWPVPAAYQV